MDLDQLEGMLGQVKSADQANELVVIPTGIDAVDYTVCGIGGLPGGRLSATFAKPSAGKSTFWQYLAGQVIKQGGLVAWIDAEGSFTWDYAKKCGIEALHKNDDGEVSGLELIDDFTSSEDAYFRVKQRLATNEYDLIVVDSVDKLVPEALKEAHADRSNRWEKNQRASTNAQFIYSLGGFEIKGANGKFIESERSRLQFVAEKGKQEKVKTWHKLTEKKTHLAIIQHAADDQQALHPDAVTTYGGTKIDYEASLRLYIKLTGTIKDSKQQLEYKKVYVRPIKNKVFSRIPGGCSLKLFPNGQVEEDDQTFFVDLAVENGLFEQSGAWYYYRGDNVPELAEKYPEDTKDNEIKFHGKDKVLEFIEAENMKKDILGG